MINTNIFQKGIHSKRMQIKFNSFVRFDKTCELSLI